MLGVQNGRESEWALAASLRGRGLDGSGIPTGLHSSSFVYDILSDAGLGYNRVNRRSGE